MFLHRKIAGGEERFWGASDGLFFDSSAPALVKNENGKNSGGRNVIKISRYTKNQTEEWKAGVAKLDSVFQYLQSFLFHSYIIFLWKLFNNF